MSAENGFVIDYKLFTRLLEVTRRVLYEITYFYFVS